jgi:membrane protein
MPSKGLTIVNGLRDLIKQIQRNEVPVTAASMAYSILFALVPLLLFIAALSGFVSRWIGSDDTVSNVIDFLFRHLPRSSAAALEEPIEAILTRQASGLLSVGAVLAIWGSRSLVSGGMRAVNKAYGVENSRNVIEQNVVALGLTIGLGFTVVIGSASILLGSRWGDKTADKLGLGETFADLWTFARWPLIGILLLGALIGFFRIAPATQVTARSVIPGALFCLFGWAIAIVALSFYFAMAGSYAAAYGILGGLLAFVFWLYVMSMVFTIGGELNAFLHRRRSQSTPPPTSLPTKRPSPA